MSTKKLTFRARRGKGGVALAMIEDAEIRRLDIDIARLLAGRPTDADSITVQRYLSLVNEQLRRGQS